jgi:hypothetical protein
MARRNISFGSRRRDRSESRWTPLRERALERKAADYSLASRRKPAKAPLFLMINEQNTAYFLKVKE